MSSSGASFGKNIRRREGWKLAESAGADQAIRERLRAGEPAEHVAESVGVALGYVQAFLGYERPAGYQRVQLPVVEEREARAKVVCVAEGARQVTAWACVHRQTAEGCHCPKAVYALNAVPAVTPREREDRLLLVGRAAATLRGGPRFLGPAAHVGEVAPLTAPGSAGLAAPGLDGACSCGERTIRGHSIALVVDKKTGRRHGRAACDLEGATPAADTTPVLVSSAPPQAERSVCEIAQVTELAPASAAVPTSGQPASLLDYARAHPDPALVPVVEEIRRALPQHPPTPPSAAPEEKTMAPKKKLEDLTDAEVTAAREQGGSDYVTAKIIGCSVYLLKKREKAIAAKDEAELLESGVGNTARENPTLYVPPVPSPISSVLPPANDIEALLTERLAKHESEIEKLRVKHESEIEKLRVHEREAARIRAALAAMKAA